MATKEVRVYITGDSTSLERAFGRASAASSGFGAGIQRAGASISRVGSTFSRVTLPVVAFGALSVKSSLDFQRSMALIQSSAGGSAQDVKELSAQVLDLARVAPQGPDELAASMFHLKSLGLDNTDAMNVLKQAVRGATAGQADLEEVTNALGGAVRTNIKGAQDYSKAMATLNAVTGAGNMRMDDLTEALGTGLLPSAKAAGLSLLDVGSALAVMTDENVPANAAATRLRMAFSLLGAPTAAANKELQQIGLSGDQLAHAMQQPNGLLTAITLLKEHLDQVQDPAERFQILSRAFGGGRSSAAILTLVNNLDVLRQKYDQISVGAGKFDSQVAAQQETALNKLKTAWSSVQVAMIQVGAALTPFVTELAGKLAQVADAFSGLSPAAQKFIIVIAAAVAVLGPTLIVVGQLVTAIGLLATPIGLATVATLALVAAFGYFYTHSQTVRDAVAAIEAKVASAFPQIRADVTQAMHAISDIVTGVANIIRAVWDRVGTTVTAITRRDFGAIVTVVKSNLDAVVAVLSLIGDVLHGRWGKIWGDLKRIAGDEIHATVAVVRAAAGSFADAAAAIGHAIVSGILSGVGGLFSALKSKLEGTLRSVLSSINPFSPVSHGGEIYIGAPLMMGAIDAITSRGRDLAAALNATVAGAVGSSTPNVAASVSLLASAPTFGAPFVGGSGGALAAAAAGGQMLVVNVGPIQGSVVSEDDLVRTVRRGLQKIAANSPTGDLFRHS